jgi:hypothetical protein
MRTHTAFAALLALTVSILQVPAFAESEPKAHLRLTVTDVANVPVPAAKVTVYTTDGRPGIDLTADQKGEIALGALPTGFVQIYARDASRGSYAEAHTLQRGPNVLSVTLHPRIQAPETSFGSE